MGGLSGNISTGPIRKHTDPDRGIVVVIVSWLDSQQAYGLYPVGRDGEEDILSKVS